jgi:hypothetical protein
MFVCVCVCVCLCVPDLIPTVSRHILFYQHVPLPRVNGENICLKLEIRK